MQWNCGINDHAIINHHQPNILARKGFANKLWTTLVGDMATARDFP